MDALPNSWSSEMELAPARNDQVGCTVGFVHVADECRLNNIARFLFRHDLLGIFVVEFAGLPNELHILACNAVKAVGNAAVNGSCTKAASYYKHCWLVGVESETLARFLRCQLAVEDILTYRIAGNEYFSAGKKRSMPS